MNQFNWREKYQAYLQTPQWKQKRIDKFSQVGYECQLCPSKTRLQVHHRTYKRLGRELLSDLTVLCEKCHKIFHKKKYELPEEEIKFIVTAEIVSELSNNKQVEIAKDVINRYFKGGSTV